MARQNILKLIGIMWWNCHFTSLQFSHSVMFNSLQTHGLQHTRLPCPSPTLRACSNWYPSSQWCHPTISSPVIPFPPGFNLSQHQGFFQWVSSLHHVAKYWSFSFNMSPSNEYSGLIPLALTGWITLQSKGLSRVFSNTTVQKHQTSVLNCLYSPTLTSIHDYWKNHSFKAMDQCWQSNVSAF